MNVKSKIKLTVTAAAVAFAMLPASGFAVCSGNFYVVSMDGDGFTQIRVRQDVASGPGTNDRIGYMVLPDSALGGANTLYQYAQLNSAYTLGTKLYITTDDTDCSINTAEENLGTIFDVSSADYS